jgi:hypothetical protein
MDEVNWVGEIVKVLVFACALGWLWVLALSLTF